MCGGGEESVGAAEGKGAEVGGDGVSDRGSASWSGAAGKGRPLQEHGPGGGGGQGRGRVDPGAVGDRAGDAWWTLAGTPRVHRSGS